MRLIDADMIPLCLITEGQDNPTKYGFKPGDTIRFRPSEVDAIVRKMPTIEGRKTGRWIGRPLAGYCTVRCSVCGDAFCDNDGRWNFCPNCGAKMDG